MGTVEDGADAFLYAGVAAFAGVDWPIRPRGKSILPAIVVLGGWAARGSAVRDALGRLELELVFWEEAGQIEPGLWERLPLKRVTTALDVMPVIQGEQKPPKNKPWYRQHAGRNARW